MCSFELFQQSTVESQYKKFVEQRQNVSYVEISTCIEIFYTLILRTVIT